MAGSIGNNGMFGSKAATHHKPLPEELSGFDSPLVKAMSDVNRLMGPVKAMREQKAGQATSAHYDKAVDCLECCDKALQAALTNPHPSSTESTPSDGHDLGSNRP